VVSPLRSFLRFLWQAGETDRDLAAAIPPIRRPRLGEVPKYLPAGDVTRLLASVDRTRAPGGRYYAILLLLARLGLRAGEVVRLELADLDWRAGEVTVRAKGSIHARLPLPRDVGDALVAYLRTERPACATRRVFVCLRAPHRGFGHPATVSTLVHVALTRAGLSPPTTGAHLLRHTLARDLLRHGASLGDTESGGSPVSGGEWTWRGLTPAAAPIAVLTVIRRISGTRPWTVPVLRSWRCVGCRDSMPCARTQIAVRTRWIWHRPSQSNTCWPDKIERTAWRDRQVPELSRFFGIIIRMFIEAGGSHHRPHFHAYYQDHAACSPSTRSNASAATYQSPNDG
jgi:hypothetical protein